MDEMPSMMAFSTRENRKERERESKQASHERVSNAAPNGLPIIKTLALRVIDVSY